MDLGASKGGLPPDSIVEDTDAILTQTEDAIRRWHDPRPGAMVRVAVAPCSPFSVTPRLMRESAALARRAGVRLHTHIAETVDEEEYCQRIFGCRPLQLLDTLEWLGPDVWLAHCVHLNSDDIQRVARTGTAVAWCPTSNLRLASGIAPARALLDAGAIVGLGVDGSASNDSGDLLAEARQGMLVCRATGDPTAMTARDLAELSGGRFVLGLGTQVKRVNEQRFGIPFEHPAPKIADHVEAVRAVLEYSGGVLDLGCFGPGGEFRGWSGGAPTIPARSRRGCASPRRSSRRRTSSPRS